MTNSVRKTNANLTGLSSGETLLQDSNHLIMYFVFVVKVDFLCVRSPHMVPEKTVPENCCTKAELAAFELQEQPLFDPCKSFEGFVELN